MFVSIPQAFMMISSIVKPINKYNYQQFSATDFSNSVGLLKTNPREYAKIYSTRFENTNPSASFKKIINNAIIFYNAIRTRDDAVAKVIFNDKGVQLQNTSLVCDLAMGIINNYFKITMNKDNNGKDVLDFSFKNKNSSGDEFLAKQALHILGFGYEYTNKEKSSFFKPSMSNKQEKTDVVVYRISDPDKKLLFQCVRDNYDEKVSDGMALVITNDKKLLNKNILRNTLTTSEAENGSVEDVKADDFVENITKILGVYSNVVLAKDGDLSFIDKEDISESAKERLSEAKRFYNFYLRMNRATFKQIRTPLVKMAIKKAIDNKDYVALLSSVRRHFEIENNKYGKASLLLDMYRCTGVTESLESADYLKEVLQKEIKSFNDVTKLPFMQAYKKFNEDVQSEISAKNIMERTLARNAARVNV